MDLKKKKDLEEKLRILINQSQEEKIANNENKNRHHIGAIVRRRKGMPDQSILSKSQL